MLIMKLFKINSLHPEKEIIKEVARKIKKGKIAIFPTETCYALGTNSLDEKAVEKIYKIKKEPSKSNIIVIVDSLKTARKYGIINRIAEKLVRKFMPGPLTLIVKKKKLFPEITNKAFAFRISSNRIAHMLAEEAKVPITATSANIHGKGSIYSSEEILKEFKGKVDIIIDAGKLKRIKPSTIIDLQGKPRLIRRGPISFRKILNVLKS